MKTFTRTVTPARGAKIQRTADGVLVFTDEGETEFDAVVLAAYADETFKMLADPTPRNPVAVPLAIHGKSDLPAHTDPAWLPPFAKARASWNYLRESQSAAHPCP
ncbi:MAG: hypothetical protein R2860_14845 [Desulfobacterales bacterium]